MCHSKTNLSDLSSFLAMSLKDSLSPNSQPRTALPLSKGDRLI